MSPARLLALWHRLGGSSAGRWLFSLLTRLAVPYTGALGSRVQSLAPGRTVVTLADRRAVRNHLGSIHAIALANLAEFASGLAMLGALGDQTRGIVTRIEIRYHKKARGVLTATGSAEPPVVTEPVEALARAVIADASGELVAEAEVTWRLAPVQG
jgi:acyl-coenzyme A thioesterase PaaI-like protein